MQLAQQFGVHDVDRVLRAKAARLVAGDKAEELDVLMQLGQRKFVLLAVFQVVQADARKGGLLSG